MRNIKDGNYSESDDSEELELALKNSKDWDNFI